MVMIKFLQECYDNGVQVSIRPNDMIQRIEVVFIARRFGDDYKMIVISDKPRTYYSDAEFVNWLSYHLYKFLQELNKEENDENSN